MNTQSISKMPGVRSLEKEELQNVDGGIILLIAGRAASTLLFMYAVDVAVNWEDHVEAFREGYNDGRKD